MAGYFITKNNNKFNELEKNIYNDFPKYKSIRNIGKDKWNVLFFQKINIEDNNIFKDGNNFIIGVGSYVYKGNIGGRALEDIYNDYIKNKFIFREVLGHFNFILFINNKISVITDKVGYYFSYQANENNDVVYSTSLSLLANYLDNIEYSKQEMLEYINVASTFGGNTIFKNIKHTQPGMYIDLNSKLEEKYFNIEIKKVSFNNYIKKVNNYFSKFEKIERKIGADLSGGFDTRTIASALLNSKVKFNFLTNDRPKSVSKDKEVAISIAKKVNKKIKVIPLEYQFDKKSVPDKEIIKKLEAARGLDILKRVFNEIQNKSQDHEVIIGGWGAEMLRNQHGRFKNVRELVKGFGYHRVSLGYEKDIVYKKNIEGKLNYLNDIKNNSKASIGELAFYLEKGKYWTGSVLSARNKYAFWVFPFFDPELSLDLLSLNSKGNSLQNKVIVNLYSRFNTIPYGNVDTEKQIVTKFKGLLKRIISFKKKNISYDYPSEGNLKSFPELEKIIEIDSQFLEQNGAQRSISKLNTLGFFLRLTKNKK